MVRAKTRRLLQPRRARRRTCSAVHTLYRDAGYANVEANPQTELDPDKQEVDIVVADPARPARLLRAHRDQGQHQDARQGHPPRDGDHGGRSSSARPSSRRSQAAHHRARLLRARRHLDRAGRATPDHINVNVEVGEKPTGTFQVGAGFSSIENFIATAQVQQANLFGNGQTLALAGADLAASASSSTSASSSRTSSTATFSLVGRALRPAPRLHRLLADARRGGVAHLRLPAHRSRELRASLTYTLRARQGLDHRPRRRSSARRSAVSVFQRLPLANLFNDGITSSLRPTLTYDTRDNRLFPTTGIFLQGSTELARAVPRLARTSSSATALTGRFYYPLDAGKSVVLKLNTEVGLVTSPRADGRAHLRALLPRRHPRPPRLPPAQRRPAPAAQPVARPERAADPQRRATSAAT